MDILGSNEADHHHHHHTSALSVESKKPANTTRSQLFLSFIGYHELVQAEMWRAAMTELVATTCFIFTLTTSIISCLDSHESDPKLLIPFAVIIIAFLLLIVTVPISGGHMSPVFTFVAVLKSIISVTRAIIYIIAQCLGTIISTIIIKNVMDPYVLRKYYFGGCAIDGGGAETGITSGVALILEFTCTFVVLYVGVTVAFDKRKCEELGLVMVCGVVAGAMGLAVFVSIMVTGKAGYTGVGLSPARCLGPALLHGGPLWDGHWVFWVGPFVACVVYYGFTKTLPREGFTL